MIKAIYPMGIGLAVEILEANEVFVKWKWSNETKLHKSFVNKNNKFRVNRIWISLDECMKTNI